MQRIVIALALCVAFCYSQTTNFTVIQLSTVYADSLNQPINSNYIGQPNIYGVFIPENTNGVNINITNLTPDTSFDCDYIQLTIVTEVLPCTEGYSGYDETYFCSFSYEINDVDQQSTDTEFIYIAEREDYFAYEVGTYWYIGVYTDYLPESGSCPFTLSISPNQTCAIGSVGQSTDYEVSVCSAPYVNVTSNNFNYNIPLGSATYDQLFKVTVPQNTGSITLTVNSSSTDLYLTGTQYAGSSTYQNDYEDESYTDTGNGYYIYQLPVYVPEAGVFYFEISNYAGEAAFNATVSIVTNVCAVGTGGYNCSFVATALSYNNLTTQNFSITEQDGWLSQYWRYFYMDIPQYTVIAPIQINVGCSNEGQFYMTKNRFPEEDSNYYRDGSQYNYVDNTTDATWILDSHDSVVGGRVYLGFYCDYYVGSTCAFSVSFSSIAATTTNAITSGSTSSAQVTTGIAFTTGNAFTTGSVFTTGLSTKAITSSPLTTGNVGSTTHPLTTNHLTTHAGTTGGKTSSAVVAVPAFVLAMIAAFLALF
jgi:hypothetical protein